MIEFTCSETWEDDGSIFKGRTLQLRLFGLLFAVGIERKRDRCIHGKPDLQG